MYTIVYRNADGSVSNGWDNHYENKSAAREQACKHIKYSKGTIVAYRIRTSILGEPFWSRWYDVGGEAIR